MYRAGGTPGNRSSRRSFFMNELLVIENLQVDFRTNEGIVPAVRNLSLTVRRGTTHGIVGESGSGKSVTCQAVMGLSPETATISVGRLHFNGIELTGIDRQTRNRFRGGDMAMIFQDPLGALNPVHTVGAQIRECLRLHQSVRGREAEQETIRLLATVGIPDPEKRAREYPHQLSGGMCQRVMIAMAISCQPSLLFADEPTTALDVTVQAQILDLLRRLQAENGMTIILISHDIGVIAEMADSLTVMRGGEVVESGATGEILRRPQHPYTRQLLSQVPSLDHPAPVYLPPSERAAS